MGHGAGCVFSAAPENEKHHARHPSRRMLCVVCCGAEVAPNVILRCWITDSNMYDPTFPTFNTTRTTLTLTILPGTKVGETDYEKERQAPNGVEWKDWEGRLTTKNTRTRRGFV